MDISAIQIIIVLVIALLVFGPARLPGFARQVGRGLREMRQQVSNLSDEVRDAVDRDDTASPPSGAAAPPPAAPAVPPAPEISDDELLDGVVVRGDSGPRETG